MSGHLKKISYYLGVIIVGVVFGLTLQFVRAAWSEPPIGTIAPGNNVEPPLNISNTGQYKQGNLVIATNPFDSNGVLRANGLIVANGNTGIGTLAPAYKLDVNGDANGKRMCINGDCRDKWPEMSGGVNGVFECQCKKYYTFNYDEEGRVTDACDTVDISCGGSGWSNKSNVCMPIRRGNFINNEKIYYPCSSSVNVFTFYGAVDHTLRITVRGNNYSESNETAHGDLGHTHSFPSGGIPTDGRPLKVVIGGGGTSGNRAESINISQQPRASNNYTAIIDILEAGRGEQTFSFSLQTD